MQAVAQASAVDAGRLLLQRTVCCTLCLCFGCTALLLLLHCLVAMMTYLLCRLASPGGAATPQSAHTKQHSISSSCC
jgi:hypothetical protein